MHQLIEESLSLVDSTTKIKLNEQSARQVFYLLENPGEPNDKLKQALAQYRQSELYDSH